VATVLNLRVTPPFGASPSPQFPGPSPQNPWDSLPRSATAEHHKDQHDTHTHHAARVILLIETACRPGLLAYLDGPLGVTEDLRNDTCRHGGEVFVQHRLELLELRPQR